MAEKKEYVWRCKRCDTKFDSEKECKIHLKTCKGIFTWKNLFKEAGILWLIIIVASIVKGDTNAHIFDLLWLIMLFLFCLVLALIFMGLEKLWILFKDWRKK